MNRRVSLSLIPTRLALFALLASLALVSASSCKGGGSGNDGKKNVTSLDPPPEPEPPGDQPAFPFVDHVDQARITAGAIGFQELFVLGDELFETKFNTIDGSGALRLPDGSPLSSRFSRVPPGGGRFTGPNGQGCDDCHNNPFGTSAGTSGSNVIQDPAGHGAPPFNIRNTISLFGSGMIQRLAEEMTEELHQIRDTVVNLTVPGGTAITRDLVAKDVSFGRISATRDAGGAVTVDLSEIEGVSPDLVVRAFGWKGDQVTLRQFSRGAARNEIGMEADELVAKEPLAGADPDGDGVEGELSVGDITALVVYIAAQESPTTTARAARDNLIAAPGPEFSAAANRGRVLFELIGCATCHVPELRLRDPIFEEPTLRGRGHFHDEQIDPVATALDAGAPFRFHLGRDGDIPRPRPHPRGGIRVPLFGDLKRHRMGNQLADAQPTPVQRANEEPLIHAGAPVVVEPAVFLTPELWGVGNTGPWLHDGRAASLEEAILLHGVDAPPPAGDSARSEAQESRDAFAALDATDREAVVTFLKSLVLVELEEEE